MDARGEGYISSDSQSLNMSDDSSSLCVCVNEFEPQMGSEQNAIAQETMKSQNVRFSDQHSGSTTMVSGNLDSTRTVTDTHDSELSDFFSRPIRIFTQQWTVGTLPQVGFDPWDLYFDNPRVENRITNYALARAKLHLKFVINGNGFYYGRMIAAYFPFLGDDDLTVQADDIDIVQASQCPHVILDPTTSMGGEMVLPFHHYKNNVDVQQAEFTVLGNIWLRAINPLLHANGGTAPITISVFAWAEDVDLSVLTSMDLAGLTPQMGDEVDEANTKGMISGPASAVSKAAGALSNVPVIAPYATATSKAAGMVAQIASLLGYCKPIVTKAPDPYRPQPVSTLAVTNVPDVSNKLTVDHKQELTIDPIIAGYGEDDMLDIKSIATRESYYISVIWLQSAAIDTSIATIRVDPCIWRELSPSGPMTFPACCAAALPFKYWTGTMKFRFQFVCSAFHKGRVRLTYDPNQVDGTDFNTAYTKIVDLAEENEVTMTVGMGQTTTLREHFRPGTDVISSVITQGPGLNRQDRGNGVIDIKVVNPLTTPSLQTDPIYINMWVSAGDDFEVFVPDSYFQQFVFRPQMGDEFVPQMGDAAEMSPSNYSPDVVADGISSDHINKPVGSPGENLAVDFSFDNKTNLVFTGESVKSFRAMLKRYSRWRKFGTFDQDIVDIDLLMFPYLRGNVSGAVDTTGAAASYNYVNTLLLHWVTYMFSGWRGSIRYKLLPGIAYGKQSWRVERFPPSNLFVATISQVPPAVSSGISATARTGVYEFSEVGTETGFQGACFTSDPVNNVLEWECPFYSPWRFMPGKREDLTSGQNRLESFRLHGEVMNQTGFGSTNELWVAAGEDFQAYFFTGLPRMYFELNAPPA